MLEQNKNIFSSQFTCLDERILEYDIDKVLFDQRSSFQKVQIVHSKSLGNMLVLDELQSKHNSCSPRGKNHLKDL